MSEQSTTGITAEVDSTTSLGKPVKKNRVSIVGLQTTGETLKLFSENGDGVVPEKEKNKIQTKSPFIEEPEIDTAIINKVEEAEKDDTADDAESDGENNNNDKLSGEIIEESEEQQSSNQEDESKDKTDDENDSNKGEESGDESNDETGGGDNGDEDETSRDKNISETDSVVDDNTGEASGDESISETNNGEERVNTQEDQSNNQGNSGSPAEVDSGYKGSGRKTSVDARHGGGSEMREINDHNDEFTGSSALYSGHSNPEIYHRRNSYDPNRPYYHQEIRRTRSYDQYYHSGHSDQDGYYDGPRYTQRTLRRNSFGPGGHYGDNSGTNYWNESNKQKYTESPNDTSRIQQYTVGSNDTSLIQQYKVHPNQTTNTQIIDEQQRSIPSSGNSPSRSQQPSGFQRYVPHFVVQDNDSTQEQKAASTPVAGPIVEDGVSMNDTGEKIYNKTTPTATAATTTATNGVGGYDQHAPSINGSSTKPPQPTQPQQGEIRGVNTSNDDHPLPSQGTYRNVQTQIPDNSRSNNAYDATLATDDTYVDSQGSGPQQLQEQVDENTPTNSYISSTNPKNYNQGRSDIRAMGSQINVITTETPTYATPVDQPRSAISVEFNDNDPRKIPVLNPGNKTPQENKSLFSKMFSRNRKNNDDGYGQQPQSGQDSDEGQGQAQPDNNSKSKKKSKLCIYSPYILLFTFIIAAVVCFLVFPTQLEGNTGPELSDKEEQ
ncbi:hypothetical protein H4219_005973 [Mycoemilia scoparia]|uniref:Uncharacterized protein n=1 Tax=Mycoemilia scoparia TaxID=417184 RepID=A0A9W7ZS69_9FUNG|nr:hypothetical protein H4219_005973 [Mycoemilia scoparia]